MVCVPRCGAALYLQPGRRERTRGDPGPREYHHGVRALVPDPYRAQLDARWSNYLRMHVADADHTEWLATALANYRDEIVHFGAQLLNDRAIRPWESRMAIDTFRQYRSAAAAYDTDPAEWERTFWNGVRDGLPPALRAKWVNPSRYGDGDDTTAP